MGIAAVELAGCGLTANPQAVEVDVGYFAVFGRDRRYVETDMGSVLGKPWDIIEPGLNVKAYPCCASTHAAIDAALSIYYGPSFGDIQRVVAPPIRCRPSSARSTASRRHSWMGR